MSVPRILCVDDDPMVVSAFQRVLRRDFLFEACASGEEALRILETSGPFPVLLADMNMPGMNGVELLSRVAERYPDMVRIMLTGNAEQRTAAEAVNRGHVFRFLSKPCSPDQLSDALRAGLQQHHLATVERELLENTLRGAVATLVEILSMVDPVSFGLGQTLRDEVRELLRALGRPVSWECEVAALLSQIGFVTIPQFVVKRHRAAQGLTGAEKDMLARVPLTGADLLAPIPRLDGVAQIVRYQRKNFDGSGFPHDDLAGVDIPYGARVLRVLIELHELAERGAARGNGLLLMREREGVFDPAIIEDVARLHHTLLPVANPSRRTLLVKVRGLEPGHVLISDLSTLDGVLIVPAGQALTAMVIEKVRNFDRMGGIREPVAVEVPEKKEEEEEANGSPLPA